MKIDDIVFQSINLKKVNNTIIKSIEQNLNRSIISSNIANKNCLVVGENIMDISILQQILTPETLSFFFKDLLEQEVFIGTDKTYAQVFKNGETNPAFSYFPKYHIELPLKNKFTELSVLLHGTFFDMISNSEEKEKTEEYQLNVFSNFKRIEKEYNLEDNEYYNLLFKLMFDKYNDNEYTKLKNVFPGLILLNDVIKKEYSKFLWENSDKLNIHKYRVLNEFFEQFLKTIANLLIIYSKYIELNFSQILNINKDKDNSKDIYFNVNSLSKTKVSKDLGLDIYLDYLYNNIFKEASVENTFMRSNSLNDFNINIIDLESNCSHIEKIKEYLKINTEIRTVLVFDKDIEKYKTFFASDNIKYKNINFIFNEENINYTYLSPENILLHSLKNQIDLNNGIKSTSYYALKETIDNNDTLNLENLFIFNIMKNIFYAKKLEVIPKEKVHNLLKIYEPLEWLTKEDYIEELKYNNNYNDNEKKSKQISDFNIFNLSRKKNFVNSLEYYQKYTDIDFISKLEDMRKKTFNSLKLNLNLIGLNIKNKNDILSLANVSDNYEYMQLIFKTMDGGFSRINEYDLSWYVNNNEDNQSKLLLDFILKRYRNNIKYLYTENARTIRSYKHYEEIKKEYDDSMKLLEKGLFFEVLGIFNYLENSKKLLLDDSYKNIFFNKEIQNNEFKELIDSLIPELVENVFYNISSRLNVKDNSILYFKEFTSDKIKLTEIFKTELFSLLEKYKNNIVYDDCDIKKQKIVKLFDIAGGIDNFFKDNKTFNDLVFEKIKEKNITNEKNEKFFYSFEKIDFTAFKYINYIRNYMEKFSKWFELNYNLNRHTPIKNIILDIEKIINGENIWNVNDKDFTKLQEELNKIYTDPDFLKMKESYDFYLFDKKNKVFKTKKDSSKKEIMESPENCLIEVDIKKVLQDITGISNYYSENLFLDENRKEVLNSIEVGYFDYFKQNGLKELRIKDFIKELENEQYTLSKDNCNLSYFYNNLYKDIKVKMEEDILNINKFNKLLNDIPQIFLEKFKNKESLELNYYSLKGLIASQIDDKYLRFKNSDKELLKTFLENFYKTTYFNSLEERKINRAVDILIERLNQNSEDLIIENYKEIDINEYFNIYQILKVYINNLKCLENDYLVEILKKINLIDELINQDLFFKKMHSVLKSTSIITNKINALRNKTNTLFLTDKIFTEINTLQNSTTRSIEYQFNDFGELNYKNLKKGFNSIILENGLDKKDTLLEVFEVIFKIQLFYESNIDNNKLENHSLIFVDNDLYSPLIENIIKEFIDEYDVAFLIFVPENNKFKLKKVFNPFIENLNTEQKIFFNVGNKTLMSEEDFLYDKNKLDINFPLGSKVTQKVKQIEEINF